MEAAYSAASFEARFIAQDATDADADADVRLEASLKAQEFSFRHAGAADGSYSNDNCRKFNCDGDFCNEW